MKIRFLRTLLFSLLLLSMSAASFAQIGVAIRIGPPALPVYEQPLCPGDGYLWTPGYWAYDNDISDYYWVPGTWVMAPEVGFLWTPAYWGWGGDGFVFYDGYWGPHVGFYGGINYGFGYFGTGFEGGRWDNGHFFYNRAVLNIDVTNIHNVYDTHVTYNNVSHVSYNGGNGGITARPNADEEAAARERHVGPVATQVQHVQAARANPQERASVNMGKPGIAATPRPGDFNDRGAVPAKEAGAPYTPTKNNAAQPSTAVHPHDLAPLARSTPNTGDPKLDKKYQQQQDKQIAQQQKERDKLQQKQDEEHVKLDKQKANDAQKQQVEQKHAQQTQQLQQRHQQQQQQLQQRQQPANRKR